MKKIISAKDVESLLKQGASIESITADAILTPSARDLIRNQQGPHSSSLTPAAGAAVEAAVTAGISAQSSQRELDTFFRTPQMEALKVEICDVGQRLWQRAYVDGNGGNIAIRVADDLALCTPTLVSKGFMKPADLCLVDLDGQQKAGEKKRTSEILMHLEIMKRQPRAKATVHCHPPHATAYAVAGVEPPTCMIPEIEVFIGKVPIAPYRTPGTPEMGQLVADLVDKHNTVLMGNHGAVACHRSMIPHQYGVVLVDQIRHQLAHLGRSRRAVGSNGNLANENLNFGYHAGRWFHTSHRVSGGVRWMTVNRRLGTRLTFHDFQVHENFASAFFFSCFLLPIQIHQT